jgi:hypothetical protein
LREYEEFLESWHRSRLKKAECWVGGGRKVEFSVLHNVPVYHRKHGKETPLISWFEYRETCEIRTPLGQVTSVPISEVSSFQGVNTSNFESSIGFLISQGCNSHFFSVAAKRRLLCSRLHQRT